ncbi:MAG: hypothetical protein E6G98_01095 [Bacillati bacterium ANGP1]|uniref:ParB/Sulfiredoxin domain-containing protein n=1 Tax=Candidatus Segetimicrobium genomatis TaxID=2569760 RepID=A0A537LYK4_9BACT|nr:MAG: hypothetical protein E6G98_01095 [Terrabacteria group bacterium ANGP1]
MTDDKAKVGAALRLPEGRSLPDLRIVPRAEVHLHEDTDPARVQRLVTRLRTEGVLRNPPIAAPRSDGGFVILDGANRTTALLALEAPAVLLQVVEYEDPAVRLDVWCHLLAQPVDLPGLLRARGLSIRDISPAEASRRPPERSSGCYVITSGGAVEVSASARHSLAETLAAVVDAYKTTNRIYRVMSADLEALREEYGSVAAVVVFPAFTKRDILEISRAPVKLPAGITRHLIPGRALRVNLPLDVLTSPGEIEPKNRWLADEIHRRLLENRIRYYPESSFLFDE